MLLAGVWKFYNHSHLPRVVGRQSLLCHHFPGYRSQRARNQLSPPAPVMTGDVCLPCWLIDRRWLRRKRGISQQSSCHLDSWVIIQTRGSYHCFAFSLGPTQLCQELTPTPLSWCLMHILYSGFNFRLWFWRSLLKTAQHTKTTLSLEVDVNDKHCLSATPKRFAWKAKHEYIQFWILHFPDQFLTVSPLLLYFVVYGGDLRGRGGSVKRP